MSEDLQKRYDHNSKIFLISYIFMGILSGITGDALMTYLNQVAPAIATSFATTMGLATLLTAFLVLCIPKIGYKKVLISGPIACIIGLVAVSMITNTIGIGIVTLLLMSGVCLFDAVLPPFLTQYTSPQKRDVMFSRVMYTNVIGMTIATFSGGSLIVWRFAAKLGVPYEQAKILTGDVAAFNQVQQAAYIGAHKDVLLMFVIVTALALIPLFFLKEVKSDYSEETKEKKGINWSVLANKYVILFLVYNLLIRFGASLIVPYFSIFLSSLGIDRSTVSQLVTAQYVAMVLFMMASPLVVKKFGKVIALGLLSALSIPFMILIANGDKFGSGMVLAVGLGLFFRSGFMNAANPISQSLPMEFVTKELRPAYSSILFICQSIGQTLAGIFTASFLFNDKFFGADGYRLAYYIAAVLYVIATVLLVTKFTKKYNRSETEKEAA